MSLPGGGESVGDAYIRIHSDGSRLSEDIRDDFKRHQKEFQQQGEDDAEAYHEGFANRNEKLFQNDLRRQVKEDTDAARTRNRIYSRSLEERVKALRAEAAQQRKLSETSAAEDRKIDRKLFQDRLKTILERRIAEKASENYIGGLRRRSLSDSISRNLAETKDEKRNEEFINNLRRRSLQDEIKRNQAASTYLTELRRRSLADALKASADAAAKQRARDDSNNEYLMRVRRRSLNDERKANKQRLVDVQNYTKGALETERDRYERLAKLNRSFANRDRKETRARLEEALALVRKNGDNSLISPLLRDLRRFNDNADKGFVRMSTGIRRSTRDLTDGERKFKRFEDRLKDFDIGRFFGKGSRNNFFNAIGSLVGAVGDAGIRGTVRLGRRLHSLGNDFRSAWREGDTLGKKLLGVANVAGGVAEGAFFGLAKAIGGGFAALNLFGAVAGPIAALLSMLGGVVVALASTIGIGLVGSVATLLPLLPVLLTGVGVIALAFAGLTKEQKKAIGVKLKPIRDELNGLRRVAQKGILSDIGPQAKAAARVIKTDLNPIVKNSAKAISGTFTTFLKGLNGPGFKKDAKVFSTEIPKAITKLGKIGTNVFTGLSGLFRNLFPYAQKFLDSLVKMSQKFTDFQHSARGTSSVKEFMDRATVSAKKLGTFIKDVYKVLRDLFKAGEGEGDSLFDGINHGLERFDRYITGKGRPAVKGFFEDVGRFAVGAGKFFGGIFKLFGALDTPQTRSALNTILTLAGQVAALVADALPAIFAFQHVFFAALGKVATDLSNVIKPLLPIIADLAADLGGTLAAAATGLADVLHPILVGLAGVARFVGAHPDIFGPIAKSLLGLYFAVKVGGALTALAELPGILAVKFNNIKTSVSNGAAGIRTGTARLQVAMAGLFLLLGSQAAGGSLGGGRTVKGTLTDVFGGAAGGALIGSTFGPWGTAIGGVAGGVLGLVNAFRTSGESAKDASARAVQALEVQKAAVDSLRTSIQGTVNDYGASSKAAIASQLSQKGVLATADKAGIALPDVVNAVTGQGGDQTINRVNSQLLAAKNSGKISKEAYESAAAALGTLSAAAATAENNTQLEQLSLGKSILTHSQLGVSVRALTADFKNTGITLATATAAGKRNAGVILQNVDAAGKFATKQLSLGKNAGAVGVAYLSQIAALRSNLIQMGFNKDAVDALIGKYNKVPKDVSTAMHVRDLVSTTLGSIKNKLELQAAKTYASKLNLNDADAASKLQAYLLKWERLHDKTITITQQVFNKGVVNAGGAGQNKAATSARGRLLTGPLLTWAGEDGPEAIVPLRRPLSQVDPSVRALSAFAQGLSAPSPAKMGSGGVVGGGRSLTIAPGAISVITPTTDPRAVAVEMINRIAAGGYA